MPIRDPLILKNLDRWATMPGCASARLLGMLAGGRGREHRPLVVRPGGMGDLILLCVAAESLGIDLMYPRWLIERRSRVWAEHLGLDYLCYDDDLAGTHWRIAGRFETVINTEQRFGLAQATAILALARGGKLVSFASNRGAGWSDVTVDYDADCGHEAAEFSRLLSAGFGAGLANVFGGCSEIPWRARKVAASGQRVVGISGLQSAQRAFSLDEWARFARRWAGGERFQIGGAPGDLPFAEALAARFPGQAQVFRGSFAGLCDLIAESPEVFTVDGGFLHVASYYGVPATAIFTSSRDRKWAPLGAGSRVVRRRDLECQPCAWFAQVAACPCGFACKEIPEKSLAGYERSACVSPMQE